MCAVIEITTTFMRNKNISSHLKYFTLAGQTILVWITVGYEIFQHVSECKRDGLLCCYFFGKHFASLCIVISYCTIFRQFYQKKKLSPTSLVITNWFLDQFFWSPLIKWKSFENKKSNHLLMDRLLRFWLMIDLFPKS